MEVYCLIRHVNCDDGYSSVDVFDNLDKAKNEMKVSYNCDLDESSLGYDEKIDMEESFLGDMESEVTIQTYNGIHSSYKITYQIVKQEVR